MLASVGSRRAAARLDRGRRRGGAAAASAAARARSFTQWQAWRSPPSDDETLLARLRRDADPRVGRRHAAPVEARTVSRHERVRRARGRRPRRDAGRVGPLRAPSRRRARGDALRRHRPHVRGLGRARRRDLLRGLRAPPARQHARRTARCDPSVAGARLEGGRPPPPPGLALGAVTWAVHHPATRSRWGAARRLRARGRSPSPPDEGHAREFRTFPR